MLILVTVVNICLNTGNIFDTYLCIKIFDEKINVIGKRNVLNDQYYLFLKFHNCDLNRKLVPNMLLYYA